MIKRDKRDFKGGNNDVVGAEKMFTMLSKRIGTFETNEFVDFSQVCFAI